MGETMLTQARKIFIRVTPEGRGKSALKKSKQRVKPAKIIKEDEAKKI